ncbi:MAG: hypothetical protein ACRBB4_16125 [Neptuniibacter sp.]
MKELPAAPATGATSKDDKSNTNRIPIKHEPCVHQLLKAGTQGINQLKALSTYHDTCLNTTISELGLKRGLTIQREKRQHIHSAGGTTHFCWYWFPNRETAQEGLNVLNQLRDQRGAPRLGEFESIYLLNQFPESRPVTENTVNDTLDYA